MSAGPGNSLNGNLAYVRPKVSGRFIGGPYLNAYLQDRGRPEIVACRIGGQEAKRHRKPVTLPKLKCLEAKDAS